MDGLIGLVVAIVIVGLVCWLLWWLIDFIGLPQPFNKVAKVLIAIFAVVWLLYKIMGIGGGISLP